MDVVFACGQCKAPLKGPADPKPEDTLSCPVCGTGDTLQNVRLEVEQFIKEEAAKAYENMLRGVASKSDTFTFNETPRPKGVYRFVAIGGEP